MHFVQFYWVKSSNIIDVLIRIEMLPNFWFLYTQFFHHSFFGLILTILVDNMSFIFYDTDDRMYASLLMQELLQQETGRIIRAFESGNRVKTKSASN